MHKNFITPCIWIRNHFQEVLEFYQQLGFIESFVKKIETDQEVREYRQAIGEVEFILLNLNGNYISLINAVNDTQETNLIDLKDKNYGSLTVGFENTDSGRQAMLQFFNKLAVNVNVVHNNALTLGKHFCCKDKFDINWTVHLFKS